MRLPLGPLAGPLGRDLRAHTLRDAVEALDRTSHTNNSDDADDDGVVSGADLSDLPQAAQRYLRYMGVVDRPRDWSFLVRLTGRFKRPGQAWMPCDAWQYNTTRPITRIFHMRIDFAKIVPMVGHDTYVAGHGEMQGKLLGLVTVANGSGPEFDLGELVTYLNDALVLAPSMLLSDSTSWGAVDDDSFSVSLTDLGHTVTGQVYLNADGSMRDFATNDRWYDGPDGLVRARWTTPIRGWTDHSARPWITGAQAVWDLPDGPLPYVDGTFMPASIIRNVAPGEI